MGDRPALSKGELEVARVLWELKKATVREVFEAIPVDRGLEFATVQTYLRRLESKGYVKADLDGRVRVYSPRVRPATVIRETVGDLVDRLFAGETLPLMRHLIEDRRVSADELAELRDLIDRMEQ
jgi:BlaI family penicillinase repressor